MPATPLSLRGIEFSYPSAPATLFRNLTISFPVGFTGVTGANGAGKSTLLKLATGILQPDSGAVIDPGSAQYCAQRTDAAPTAFRAMLDDNGRRVFSLRDRFGIEWDWLERWETLSHGERKRAQIGCALWQEPEILALDEPTNHLDYEGQRLLLDALSEYPGIALIVSHDREVLDALCSQCLWVESGAASLYTGGYSKMQASRTMEAESIARIRSNAVRNLNAIKREEVRRREEALKAHRARSKRRIDPKDHSTKAAINARINTDSKDGRRLNQIEKQVDRAEAAVARVEVRKPRRTGIELKGAVCKRNFLFHLSGGEIQVGRSKILRYPELEMVPADRVGLTGLNGSGKSSLLAFIRKHLNIESERVIYLPQEITRSQTAKALAQVKALPRDLLGQAMQVIDSLGSCPRALLDSVNPSPGELRKLMIALGMTRNPYLLILDEPANHMDLPSIEALEEALASSVSGLLLVSHDPRFLSRLTSIRWSIEGHPVSPPTGKSPDRLLRLKRVAVPCD